MRGTTLVYGIFSVHLDCFNNAERGKVLLKIEKHSSLTMFHLTIAL